MGLHASTSAETKALRGLHLYHFVGSNCSQRVRIALEEKGVAWTSHHLNLAANEHATPAYREINPNGVVPTLVHDGRVYIESNDIIAYLDESFPEPRLTPADPGERKAMEERIAAAGAIQPAVKALSHERLFKPFRKVGPAEIERIDAALGNRELVAFLRDYAEDGAAWRTRVARAEQEMDAALTRLERALGAAPWLSGRAFGLADVSWVVNLHRLLQAKYSLAGFPRLATWYARILARPSFRRAVLEWRPGAGA
jgi:glutathione S-transferase